MLLPGEHLSAENLRGAVDSFCGALLARVTARPFQIIQILGLATGGRSRHDARYGLTSLPAWVASPERLLALVRGQWQIENGLHYRRDMTDAVKITRNCA